MAKKIFLKLFPLILLEIFLLIILVGTLFYKAEFCMVKYGDVPVLIKQNLWFLSFGFLIACIFYYLIWIKIKTKSLNFLFKNRGIWYFLIIIFQILVIFCFIVKPTADWEVFYSISQQIISGDFSGLNRGGYLYAYPHNLGITLYYVFFNFLSPNNFYLLRFLNIFYSLITFFLINKMFTLLTDSYVRKYNDQFFVFTLLFIPTIFMVNMIYNEVLSTMLFLFGVYLSIKFVFQKKISLLPVIAFLFSLGNFVRSLGFIFLLADVLYFRLMKINFKIIFLFVILTIFGFFSPLGFANLYLYRTGKIEEPLGKNSVPIIKWIHLGLNKKYFGYWDQGESFYMYVRDASWSKEKAKKIYYESIKNKIKEYGWLGIANIYFKKLVWLWTEGTYQSVYLGMSHNTPGGYIQETAASRFFNQKIEYREPFKIVMYFNNLFSLFLIFIFIGFVFLTQKWELLDKEMILVLILLGFFFFYLLWEVKPRYIYPVYPYILLFSGISLAKLVNYFHLK